MPDGSDGGEEAGNNPKNRRTDISVRQGFMVAEDYSTGMESTRTNFWINVWSSLAIQDISFAVRSFTM